MGVFMMFHFVVVCYLVCHCAEVRMHFRNYEEACATLDRQSSKSCPIFE